MWWSMESNISDYRSPTSLPFLMLALPVVAMTLTFGTVRVAQPQALETSPPGPSRGMNIESVATAGDVNGDGCSHVIVGAPYYDNGQENEGRALVYHGSANGL
jgi:hypothetical protein